MPPDVPTPEQQAWLTRVRVLLGRPRKLAPMQVQASVTAQLPPPPPRPGGLPAVATGRARAAIAPSRPPAPARPLRGAGGKAMSLAQQPDGRVTLSYPPPPVRQVTFSGGGGKGAAMPGAVRALENAGVLKNLTQVSGASVGSMTAALVAAGASAKEFAEVGNDPAIASKIKEGKNFAEVLFGGGLGGEGLEGLVRNATTRTVGKRIVEYVQAQQQAQQPIAPEVLAIAHKLADGKKGPTFGDLRALAKHIPAIKEVSVSASFMTAVDAPGGKPVGEAKPRLMIFSADTQPDMEVALAVHASAALPPVFKPVDIPLADGRVGRFQDGGVLNNAPNEQTTGEARELDPMPEQRGMTFVFEDESAHELLEGVAVPRRSRVADWIAGAENSAAEYAKNRTLADTPGEVVMLPLVFSVPPAKGPGQGTKKDFSGLLSGTTNFDMAETDKLQLQLLAEDATGAQLHASGKPRERSFDSPGQMLMCLPRGDLQALAGDGFEGANDALAFRNAACQGVAALVARVQGLAPPQLAALAGDNAVRGQLDQLQTLAGADADRQAFVARELNRSGRLDALLAAMAQAQPQGQGNAVVEAGHAVAEALRARTHARRVLRELIYPKMVRMDPKKPAGQLLKQMDDRLRRADSPEEVNDALQRLIAHFAKKTDPLGLLGHRDFADALEGWLMKPA